MPVVEAPPVTTLDEFLALPDDGVRNRFHSTLMARLSGELYAWWLILVAPRGEVVCGEAGVRLPGRDAVVGVDVAYVPPDVMVRQTDASTLIEGRPALVVEILSPSDTMEAVDEKLAGYRAAGVPLAWVVDPADRTVTVYAAGDEPVSFNVRGELDGGSALPGLRVPVARLFE